MNIPQRYFPFGEAFNARMGGRPLQAGDPLCEIDLAHYHSQVQRRRAMLQERRAEYFRGGEHTLTAQWDVLALVLGDLAASYPAHFQLERRGRDWRWRNLLLDEACDFRFGDAASLPCEPLEWVGRQVQDDLVLVSGAGEHRMLGGLLCFGNAWSVGSHTGKAFLEIHQPTPPATMPAVQAGYRVLDQLRPGKSIWRLNWNFKFSGELDLTTRQQPRYAAQAARRISGLTVESVGRDVFLRVERQTLTRLRESGAVLFGIHTYLSRLEDEAADPQRARSMLAVLRSAPPDVKEYKGIVAFEEVLVRYLEARAMTIAMP